MAGTLSGRRIAVIGLGLMGKPMARNLQRAGAEVIVHNRSPGPQQELAGEGMVPASSPAEAARLAGDGVILLMLTDSRALETVLRAGNGVFSTLSPGALLIDMGTSEVPLTRALAAEAAAKGADYVDAPVSGGQIGAEDASLTIMAGGSEAAMARALPVLQMLGRRITRLGEVGSGQVAKAANQMIVGMTIGAVAEALALARAAGVDPTLVREALKGGFADSRILEVHGQRMADGAFEPGGRITVQLKDVRQALELAEGLGIALPGLQRNRELWERMVAQGWGDLDHSALIKTIENPPEPA